MVRLSRRGPDELDGAALALHEKITSGPRGASMTDERGALVGPFTAMLLSPPVGDALQELGAAIRYRSTLPPRARELAILTVADHWGSAFERRAHESAGRAAGLTEEELATLHSDDPFEAAVIGTTRRLLESGDLTDDEYAALDERTLFELTTLVGYYATLAMQLRVYRIT
ncbi:hypothetical protein GCM10010404_49070 [Nonomuraea africana]|uniref:4-carboxymuconolactone decarboxylase n=1 Tax=Nonomuraea africana TaxID=46171 RepID=A0ABR9KVV4_9ACTN|nr:carboxymuconolactone decarboxylase family protein [Nonomuraea africana]MBE1566125.1 4-carboxymuconolactone decarboxylase [Nonomuraea africana]